MPITNRLLTLLFAFCLFQSTLNAQATDRFIRVAGNAERTIKAENMIVGIYTNEITPTDYRQSRYKSLEQVKEELVAELTKIGIATSGLMEDNVLDVNNQYQKVRQKRYKLVLPGDSQVGKLADIYIEGVAIRELRYSYKAPPTGIEDELTIDAIKDATKKAERLAKETGKKLGKVLNVEDNSNGCCKEIRDSNTPSNKFTYRVYVTFELLD